MDGKLASNVYRYDAKARISVTDRSVLLWVMRFRTF